jgi:hypothetical protein
MQRTILVTALAIAALAAGCGGGSNNTVDATPLKGCPVALRLTTLAGSISQLGFTGRFTTGAPIGGEFDVAIVSHDGDANNCSIAEFQGPVANTAEEQQYVRCISDPTKTCSTDNDCPAFRCLPNPQFGGLMQCQNTGQSCTSDAQCMLPGPSGPLPGNFGTCKYMLGPPISTPPSGGGGSVCTIVALTKVDGSPGIHGTIDFVHGTVNLDTYDVVPYSDYTGACNVCNGDDRPLDGMKHGTCQQGPSNVSPAPATNAACDIAGTNQGIPGSYSFDCSSGASFISLPTSLAPMSSDGTRWTLDSTRPTGPNGRVWCGTCQTAAGSDTWQTCTSSADCNGGTCVATTPDSMPLAANACAGGVCNYDPLTGGTCTAAGSGAQPTIFCLPGANDAVATAIGASTILDQDRLTVRLAGLSCYGAGRSRNPSDPLLIGLDQFMGLPGPDNGSISLDIEKIYASQLSKGIAP